MQRIYRDYTGETVIVDDMDEEKVVLLRKGERRIYPTWWFQGAVREGRFTAVDSWKAVGT